MRTRRPSSAHVDVSTFAPPLDGDGERGSRDTVPATVRRRAMWERGWSAWDAGHAGREASVRAVMSACGVDESVARGWVELGDEGLGLPSYRERLRDAARELVARDRRGETVEAVERRGMEDMARDRAAALAKARKAEKVVLGDAVRQRSEEAKLVRGVRQTATAMLSAEGHLLKAAIELAKGIDADVASGAFALKPREKVALVKDIASIVKATAETAKLAVVTERLVLGKPGAVLGPDAPPTDMTPEEAEAYVAIASRAIARRARQRTIIDVDASPDVGGE